MLGDGSTVSIDCKASLLRVLRVVDVVLGVALAIDGVETVSSPVSVSDTRVFLPDRPGRLRVEPGVGGTMFSSVSAVEARVLGLERPRLTVDVVDGVGGGGMDSRSGSSASSSFVAYVDCLLISVMPALVRRTRSRSRSNFFALGKISSSRMRMSWAFLAEAG